MKYGLLLFFTIIGIGYLLLVLRFFDVFMDSSVTKLKYLVINGSVGLVATGWAYIGVFRYGYYKVRALIMAVYIGLLIGPQLTHFLLQISRKNGSGFIPVIDRISVPGVVAIVAAALVSFGVSYRLATKTLTQREL